MENKVTKLSEWCKQKMEEDLQSTEPVMKPAYDFASVIQRNEENKKRIEQARQSNNNRNKPRH